MANSITAFLPCRKGSERIKQKNTRDFGGIKGGLTAIKIGQLIKTKNIDSIIVSTDDDDVKNIAQNFQKNSPKPVKIIDRPTHLGLSTTRTDELIAYVPEIISEGIVLWTHVTSPFIFADTYDDVIETFFKSLKDGHDSLMTVSKLQTFIWHRGEPLNYNRDIEKWPRTQTLPHWHEVNSGIFLAPIEVYKKTKDRIGARPFLYEIDHMTGFDIDWEDDFYVAEMRWSKLQEHV
ncbi:MAG: acylneuraminate cytidylyltransferase family protein [Parcubacteria group bacterium]|nr:acylneuraminate cytidylyltransferase family protein [Parcubacteria group bacterium]